MNTRDIVLQTLSGFQVEEEYSRQTVKPPMLDQRFVS